MGPVARPFAGRPMETLLTSTLSAQCHLLDWLLRPFRYNHEGRTLHQHGAAQCVNVRSDFAAHTHESDRPSEDEVSRDGLAELQRVALPEANSNFHNGDGSIRAAAQHKLSPLASRTAKFELPSRASQTTHFKPLRPRPPLSQPRYY
jgi:hypothetical protein